MKACKLYIDTNAIAKRLGVESDQIVISDIEGNHSELTFMVFIDGEADIKDDTSIKTVDFLRSHGDIRRQRL